MSTSIPQEALDAQKRIEERRRELHIVTKAEPTTDAGIDAAMGRLGAALANPERAAERQAFERRQQAKRATELLDLAKCPKRHLLATDLDRTSEWGNREASIAKRLGSGFIIALTGTRGCGKTQIAVELVRRLAADGKRSLYCTAVEFLMEVKANYKSDAQGSEKQVIDRFSKPALLVIDEIGKRGDTDWENRLLYELINRRYNAMVDTLVISNQEASELEGALGPSIVSRMQETGGVICCEWESYRR